MKRIVGKKEILMVLAMALTGSMNAELNDNLFPLINNVPGRSTLSLNGQWDYIIDRYGTGYYDYRLKPSSNGFFRDQQARSESDLVEYNFEQSPDMFIPHDWNTWDDELKYYEGIVWFRKVFDPDRKEDKRYFLYFGAVNYNALVYLNGTYLGSHKGGFTPFNFEITNRINDGNNTLIVMVDNTRDKDEVPTVNTDWWNYGGITRDVMIIEEPETFIIDYSIRLSGDTYKEISGWIQMDGSNLQIPVTVEIPDLKAEVTVVPDESGRAAFAMKAKPVLWSPENPVLYRVVISTPGSTVDDLIAFRHVEAVGNKIHLNGKPVYLRGICIHEEAPFRQGRLSTPEEARTLLQWAREMNCNFVRLAHYPHNEHMVREAEKMGIMVWSEIPVYWTISFDNPETLGNAKNQLEEMITRDRNRGAVIIWSLANETPVSDARNQFLTSLVHYARELDDTRLISMAMEKQYRDRFTPVIRDPLMDVVDVVSFNSYIGWYDGLPEKCARMNWDLNTGKPAIMSEFGGGALQGLHGSSSQRWTEEFQEELYRQHVAMFEKMDLAGTTPWILMDFMSPRRLLPGIQDGVNRKGLISNNGIRKKAFYIMQDWYKTK
ncbi:MAG: beta galactosidase jelly roll domain-containing protein [Bacteroidales bacterium]|nr:beta galactosidase jelly roll domain-containing protein [Bacteroidales bacterium]